MDSYFQRLPHDLRRKIAETRPPLPYQPGWYHADTLDHYIPNNRFVVVPSVDPRPIRYPELDLPREVLPGGRVFNYPEEVYVKTSGKSGIFVARDNIAKAEALIHGVPYNVYRPSYAPVRYPNKAAVDTGMATFYYLEPKDGEPNYEACYTRSCQTRKSE